MEKFESEFLWYYQLWRVAYIANCAVLVYAIICLILDRGKSDRDEEESTFILRCPPLHPEVVYLLILALVLLIFIPVNQIFNRFLFLIWVNLSLMACVIQCHNWKKEQGQFSMNWLMQLFVQNAVTFLFYMTLITITSNAASLMVDIYISLSAYFIMVPNIIAAMTLLSIVVDLYLCNNKTRYTISPHLALMTILISYIHHNWGFVIYLIINCILLIWKIGHGNLSQVAFAVRIRDEEVKSAIDNADSSSKKDIDV